MNAYTELVYLRSGKIKEIPKSRYAFYNEWYYTVIRELLRFFPFNGDYYTLSRMLEPSITVHEAKRATAGALILESHSIEQNTLAEERSAVSFRPSPHLSGIGSHALNPHEKEHIANSRGKHHGSAGFLDGARDRLLPGDARRNALDIGKQVVFSLRRMGRPRSLEILLVELADALEIGIRDCILVFVSSHENDEMKGGVHMQESR